MLRNTSYVTGDIEEGRTNMPPKPRFTREQIVEAALDLVRQRGFRALTARELATRMGMSTRPIFSYFDSMEGLKSEVFSRSKEVFGEFIKEGLKSPVPFLGLGLQYIRFARQEPQLFRLLFLSGHEREGGSASEAFEVARDLALDVLFDGTDMDEDTAKDCLRDLWLVVFSLGTLIVVDDCPYSDEQICDILSEVNQSLVRAYRTESRLPHGDYDKAEVLAALERH